MMIAKVWGPFIVVSLIFSGTCAVAQKELPENKQTKTTEARVLILGN
jgi:hypothetical protein